MRFEGRRGVGTPIAIVIAATAITLGVLSAPSSAPVIAQEVPAPRTILAADHRLFGCRVAGVREGQLLRRYTGDVPYDDDGPLPASAARGLEPRARTVSVLGPQGACTPRLGAMHFAYETGGDPIVGQAIGGCGRALASLALLDCEVPAWLRYHALDAHIERLPRTGPLADPDLEALAQRPMPFLVATEGQTSAERRALLRRRVRRSTVRTEREELRVLELHRFLEGAHPCERAESIETSVAVRRVDRDPPGPWGPLSPTGRVFGAYVDDAGWIVALDAVQSPRDGHCEVGPAHMLTCDLLAVETREGTTLATSAIGYGMNATYRGATSLLAHERACNETGF